MPPLVVAQIETVVGANPEFAFRSVAERTHGVGALIGALVGQRHKRETLLLDDDAVQSSRMGEHQKCAIGIPHKGIHHVIAELLGDGRRVLGVGDALQVAVVGRVAVDAVVGAQIEPAVLVGRERMDGSHRRCLGLHFG